MELEPIAPVPARIAESLSVVEASPLDSSVGLLGAAAGLAWLGLGGGLGRVPWWGLRRRAPGLPPELDLYHSSPFRVLALDPAESTTRSVLRRRDELRALTAVGLDPREHLSGFEPLELWADRREIEAPAVDAAVAALQSPPERLRRELVWFHLEGERPNVVDALRKGDLETAAAVWGEQCAGTPETVREGQALLNLAVARHLQVLEEERRRPFRLGGLRELRALWLGSLELWARAVASDACWELVRHRAGALADPRVGEEHLDRLRRDLPGRLLAVNAALALRGAELGRLRYARLHLGLLRSGSFPAEACREAERVFFARHIEEIEVALGPIVASGDGALDEVDGKVVASRIRRAARRAGRFRGQLLLGRELATLVGRARRRLDEDLKSAVEEFHRVDREAWNVQQALVEQWNQVMTAYNQGFAGVTIRDESGALRWGDTLTELRRIYAEFRRAESRLRRLKEPVAGVKRASRRSQVILGALFKLLRGTGQAELDRLRDALDLAGKLPDAVAREGRLTREHHQRNVNGMATNLGGG